MRQVCPGDSLLFVRQRTQTCRSPVGSKTTTCTVGGASFCSGDMMRLGGKSVAIRVTGFPEAPNGDPD